MNLLINYGFLQWQKYKSVLHINAKVIHIYRNKKVNHTNYLLVKLFLYRISRYLPKIFSNNLCKYLHHFCC